MLLVQAAVSRAPKPVKRTKRTDDNTTDTPAAATAQKNTDTTAQPAAAGSGQPARQAAAQPQLLASRVLTAAQADTDTDTDFAPSSRFAGSKPGKVSSQYTQRTE